MALCYALQEEENELTATDAYGLGLIDEVVGIPEIQPERLTMEAEPDAARRQIALDLVVPRQMAALPEPAQEKPAS